VKLGQAQIGKVRSSQQKVMDILTPFHKVSYHVLSHKLMDSKQNLKYQCFRVAPTRWGGGNLIRKFNLIGSQKQDTTVLLPNLAMNLLNNTSKLHQVLKSQLA